MVKIGNRIGKGYGCQGEGERDGVNACDAMTVQRVRNHDFRVVAQAVEKLCGTVLKQDVLIIPGGEDGLLFLAAICKNDVCQKDEEKRGCQ